MFITSSFASAFESNQIATLIADTMSIVQQCTKRKYTYYPTKMYRNYTRNNMSIKRCGLGVGGSVMAYGTSRFELVSGAKKTGQLLPARRSQTSQ